MGAIEREIVALRIQEFLINEHGVLISVQGIEDAMELVFDKELEAEIRGHRLATAPIPYELTDAGREVLK